MVVKVLPIPGWWRVCAVCDSTGRAPAIEALTIQGGVSDPHASSRRLMWAYLEHVAQLQYPPRNTTVSHQIDVKYGLWEYIKGDLRMVFFYDEGKIIVLSHGFIKDSRATPKGEIVRGRKSALAYRRAKRERSLNFVEERNG